MGHVFLSSMTVQSFITIKWQRKQLSMIKIFSDHLKRITFAPYLLYINQVCVSYSKHEDQVLVVRTKLARIRFLIKISVKEHAM